MKKRCLAMVLALVLCLSLFSAGASAAQEEEEITTETVTEETTEELTEESTMETAEETSEETAEETAGETAGETAEETAEETKSALEEEETVVASRLTAQSVNEWEPVAQSEDASTDGVSGTCGARLTWALDTDGVLTIRGTGTMTNYLSQNGVPWYYYRTLITSIVVESGVTSVGDYAFYECTNLTNVSLPESITDMGEFAFAYCSGLSSITIPNGVRTLKYSVFRYCTGLVSVVIPDGVTKIERSAFYYCSALASVTIPDSVTEIGEYAFQYCKSITDVYITSIAAWCGITFINADSNPLSRVANLYVNGELATDIVIPDTVTSIGNWTFRCCVSLTSVMISDSVMSIGRSAFYHCTNLTSVTLPNCLLSIGEYAFEATVLASITIPDSVTSIGEGAFQNCSNLMRVELPGGLSKIASSLFYSCGNLKSVVIPESVTSVGGSAFKACGDLVSVTIPDSMESIGGSAFQSCSSLMDVTIPDGVTSIGSHAFHYCSSLTEIVIPDSVTNIDNWAFAECTSLTSASLGRGVTVIGESVFRYCSKLASVAIPYNVTSINSYAFQGCDKLNVVYYAGSAANWEEVTIHSNNDCLASATIQYYATCTFPKGYNFYTDSYGFSNGSTKISETYYTTLYEKASGKVLYEKKGAKRKGSCFGIAYTTASIYNGLPSCSDISNASGFLGLSSTPCLNIRDIKKGASLAIGNNKMTVNDYIRYAHIYQWSTETMTIRRRTQDDLEGLFDAVKSYTDSHRIGIAIAMTHFKVDSDGHVVYDSKGKYKSTSHEVLAVGYDGNDILVDDSNFRNSLQRITINDDGSWSYSGAWEADGVSSFNSNIAYQENYYRPYEILRTGITTTVDSEALDSVDSTDATTETYVEGMDKLDAASTLLYLDCDSYDDLPDNAVEIMSDVAASGDDEDEEYTGRLYWLTNDDSVSLSNVSGTDNTILLAGDDTIITITAGELGNLTGTINEGRQDVGLQINEADVCSITYETVSEDTDVIVCVSGTAEDGSVSVQSVEDGLQVAGLSEGEITLYHEEKQVCVIYFSDENGDFTVTYDNSGENDSISTTADTETVEKKVIPGDINGDGEVTIIDVLALLKYVAGIDTNIVYGDVNNDGVVTILDVLALLKSVAGIAGSEIY